MRRPAREQLHAQGHGGLPVDVHVDATDRGLLVGRPEPQSQRVSPGDPPGGQPLQLGGTRPGEAATGELGRQQVDRRGQPDRHVGVDGDVLRLIDPAERAVAPMHQVGLAGGAERRDPPRVRVAPPHAHPVAVAEQLGETGQRVVGRQRDVARGLGVAREGLVARGPHPLEQRGGSDRGLAGGQRPHDHRGRDQQQHDQTDTPPTPHSGHLLTVRPGPERALSLAPRGTGHPSHAEAT